MKEKLFEGLAEALEMEKEQVKEEDTFRDYDNYDSLTELSVLAMLDEEFGVELEMQEYNKCQTVGDLLAMLAGRQ